MSELTLLDTNILVNAVFEGAEHYLPSCALLDQAANPEAGFCLLPQNVAEFYAAVTNPRRVSDPKTSAEALRAIADILALPGIGFCLFRSTLSPGSSRSFLGEPSRHSANSRSSFPKSRSIVASTPLAPPRWHGRSAKRSATTRSATHARRSRSVTAMNCHGWRLPLLGANVPASQTPRT